VNQITGNRSERSDPSFILARLGLAVFLTMNVMAMSLVLYAGDPVEGSVGAVDPLHLGLANTLRYALMAFSAPVLALLAWPILDNGLRALGRRGAGVDSLIALGTIAAFGVSVAATLRGTGAVYYETACMILVLVTLGRYLEAQARSRAAAALRGILTERPGTACVLRDGGFVEAPAAEVRVGEHVRVVEGAVIPVDGTVLDGEGGVDESSLTGEPLPVRKVSGSAVFAGTTSVDGAFLLRATATGEDRMAARIERLLAEARAARTPIELTADAVAAAFVPAAAAAALATGIFWGLRADPGTALMHALSVLLIACPCALGLATPLAVWTAIARAARRGIVIRSGEALERLAGIRTVFLDKTGTLTEAVPHLVGVVPSSGENEAGVLSVAAALEAVSAHPLARSITEAARQRGVPSGEVRRFKVHPGVGVEGEVRLPAEGFRSAAVGGGEMLRRLGVAILRGDAAQESEQVDIAAARPDAASRVYVMAEGRILGRLLFEERLRDGAEAAIAGLKEAGLRVEVLTGDTRAAVALSRRLGVRVRSGLSPSDKVEAIGARESEGGPAAMVGEGINDAPALARASLSLSLGCGDGVTRDASDISLLRDDLRQIPWLVSLSRRTLRTIRVNLGWAFVYNAALIPLAAAGALRPVLAALAMIASSLFVVGNSLRREDAPGDPAGGRSPRSSGAPPGALEAWAR